MMMRYSALCPLVALATLLLFSAAALHADPDSAEPGSSAYRIETLAAPEGVVPETDALAFTPGGRLMVGFHRGQIYSYDPGSETWTLFAEGLHDPMGIHTISDREIFVAQRPELTRLIDTDGDGRAERYETVSDDFGLAGNYHEFSFGVVRDEAGNLYTGLSDSSHGAGVRYEVRGRYEPRGRHFSLGHYSPVSYRGWIAKVRPDGGFVPFASGVRQPNGLGVSPEGVLFAADNEGNWVGTSRLIHVRKGHFYGHAMSLVWREGFDHDPLRLPVAEIDRMRTPAAVEFPQGVIANSPSEPVWDTTGGKFGPFAGQMLIGSINYPRLVRVMLEKVDGQYQGACVPFLEGAGLPTGSNRLAFGPDGSLYVGFTKRQTGWSQGSMGLARVTFTGETPMDVLDISLTEDGFDLTFTRPVDPATAADPETYQLRRYYYRLHRFIGSDQYDVQPVSVSSAEVSDDGRRVSLKLDELVPGRIHEIDLSNLSAADGTPIAHPLLAYTVNRLRDGTGPRRQPSATIVHETEATLEAEDAPSTPGLTLNERTKSHTGRGCLQPGTKSGSHVEWWAHLDQPAGRYQLTFRYQFAGNEDRTLKMTFNRRYSRNLSFEPGDSSEKWRTLSTTVPLDAGDNLIRLNTTGSTELRIDHLRLRRLD